MSDWEASVVRAAAGDPEATRELIERFQDMAVGYAYSIVGDFALAEDVCQEAFLQLFRELPALREPRALPSFLRRIVFKYCDRATRRRALPTTSLEPGLVVASADPDPMERLMQDERRSQVGAAIRSLPDTERAVLTLFHIREHSLQEICAFLDLGLPRVKNALRRARGLLRERVIEMVEEELRSGRPSRDEGFSEAVRYFRAIESGDDATVRRLVAAQPALVEQRRGKGNPSGDRATPGMTALQCAASFGHDAIVDFLLEQGADIGATHDGDDPRGRVTALHFAAYGGHASTVELLLARGADVSTGKRASDPSTAPAVLDIAGVFYDRPEIAKLLIERGAPLTLFAAVGLGLEDALREMIVRDPTLLSQRTQGDRVRYTPLHVAANRNLARVVELLLELGAPIAEPDAQGRSPIDLAFVRGHVESYRALEAAGAAPRTSLVEVAGTVERARELDAFLWMCGDDANVAALREKLASDPTLAHSVVPNFWPDNYVGAGALHFAAWTDAREVARLLIEHGADPNAPDTRYGGTASGWARENARSEMAELLDQLAEPRP